MVKAGAEPRTALRHMVEPASRRCACSGEGHLRGNDARRRSRGRRDRKRPERRPGPFHLPRDAPACRSAVPCYEHGAMKVIGLVGGIGSGKSTAAAMLAELGATVIDADRLGHEAYVTGSAGFQRVVQAFGSEVVGADGAIDRARLGARVFADPARLRELEAIVHPLIQTALAERVAAARRAGDARGLVIEAAILLEAGWSSLFEEIWVVCAPRSLIEQRLAEQRGLSAEAVAARARRQMTDAERRSRAAVVIENDGSRDDLRRQLQQLWNERILGRV